MSGEAQATIRGAAIDSGGVLFLTTNNTSSCRRAQRFPGSLVMHGQCKAASGKGCGNSRATKSPRLGTVQHYHDTIQPAEKLKARTESENQS